MCGVLGVHLEKWLLDFLIPQSGEMKILFLKIKLLPRIAVTSLLMFLFIYERNERPYSWS